MKRVKVIKGEDYHASVTITIELESTHHLARDESERLMDALAGKVMALFQASDVPYIHVPLVRLKVR